jgi:hypothetical protein
MSIETTKNDSISALAEQLWKQAGQPAGRDLEFWLQAETQLLAGTANRPQGAVEAPATPVLGARAAASAFTNRAPNAVRLARQEGKGSPKKGGSRGR